MTAQPLICKSDLVATLEAASAAGWEQVSVTFETPDGRKIHITAASATPAVDPETIEELTPLERWRAGHASK